jgi:predicted PurR-regulated permease PerM
VIYDAVIVGLLWLTGLLLLSVPFAPVWALLGALFQFVPHIGTLLAVFGPAVTAAIDGGWESLLYTMILYGIIVVVDSENFELLESFLQPSNWDRLRM